MTCSSHLNVDSLVLDVPFTTTIQYLQCPRLVYMSLQLHRLVPAVFLSAPLVGFDWRDCFCALSLLTRVTHTVISRCFPVSYSCLGFDSIHWSSFSSLGQTDLLITALLPVHTVWTEVYDDQLDPNPNLLITALLLVHSVNSGVRWSAWGVILPSMIAA